MVAAGGPEAAELAGEVGDGLIATSPEAELVERVCKGRRRRQPRYGQLTVCWAESEAEARRTAHEWWPNAALQGRCHRSFRCRATSRRPRRWSTEDDVAEAVVCGPDPERHLEAIEAFAHAGFDHVYVHQVGPDQAGFFDFYEKRVLEEARELTLAAGFPRRRSAHGGGRLRFALFPTTCGSRNRSWTRAVRTSRFGWARSPPPRPSRRPLATKWCQGRAS